MQKAPRSTVDVRWGGAVADVERPVGSGCWSRTPYTVLAGAKAVGGGGAGADHDIPPPA